MSVVANRAKSASIKAAKAKLQVELDIKEDGKWQFALYLHTDSARMLTDFHIELIHIGKTETWGAIGSNWQAAGTYYSLNLAEKAGREHVRDQMALGYSKGSWHAATF